jgi:hypothetical protein
VLNAHDALGRPIQAIESAGHEYLLVLDVWYLYRDRLGRRGLETQLAIPRHILDRKKCAVGQDFKIKVAIRPEGRAAG